MHSDQDDIIQRLIDGKAVSMSEPQMPRLGEIAAEAFAVLKRFNQESDLPALRSLFGELT